MDAYEELQKFLEAWKHLETRTLAGGTICIGPPSAPGKMDYLFYLHSPLSELEVETLQSQLHAPMHADLKSFYLNANGFASFRGWLRIFGYRRTGRSNDLEVMLDQPIDIVAANEIDSYAQEHMLIKISSYADRTPVYLQPDGGCHALSLDGRMACEWNNLAHWLRAELQRFGSYLDRDGRGRVEFSTIPAPQLLS